MLSRSRMRESIEVVLASLDEREREEMAQALAEWMCDRNFCESPGERRINQTLTNCLERRGIDVEQMAQEAEV